MPSDTTARPAVAVALLVSASVLWWILLRMREELVAQREAATAPVRNADVPGELLLRVGEGYTFGTGPRPRGVRDACDVSCLDIRAESCDLRCPQGAAPVLEPVTAAGLPETALAAAALIGDAPHELTQRALTLLTHPGPNAAGLGFLRTRSGATLALWLLEVVDDPDVLARQARIGYAPVPVADDGGALRLPRRADVPSESLLRAIRTARAFGPRMPNRGLAAHLDGVFEAVDAVAEPGGLDDRRLTIAELTDQHMALRGGALFVGRVGREASIELQGHGAVGVVHDLVGVVRSDADAFLFVGDDVWGTLDMSGPTTAIVLGSVLGTVRLRGQGDLFVRGDMLGTLDCEGAAGSVFLQTFRTGADVERLGGSSELTLYLNLSDLPPGRHEGIGRWRAVVAGGTWWEDLVR